MENKSFGWRWLLNYMKNEKLGLKKNCTSIENCAIKHQETSSIFHVKQVQSNVLSSFSIFLEHYWCSCNLKQLLTSNNNIGIMIQELMQILAFHVYLNFNKPNIQMYMKSCIHYLCLWINKTVKGTSTKSQKRTLLLQMTIITSKISARTLEKRGILVLQILLHSNLRLLGRIKDNFSRLDKARKHKNWGLENY